MPISLCLLQNLPYVGQISGGLKEGMALYLQGVFPTNADQFELNFKTGPSDNDDIAFHFNPRMDQKVVMNSFRNGGWEAEESVSDNPFIKGQPFEMFIVVKSEGYVVKLCTFKHRIPLEKVAMLNISGNVAVNLFGFIQVSKIFCSCANIAFVPCHNILIHIRLKSILLCLLQTIPYMGPISGGLREGMALYLQGVIPANADRGPTDKHETAFHFNPRMGSKVVMNSFSTGKWETEESFSDNPFKKGEDFDMFFVVKSEGYQVCVFRHKTCSTLLKGSDDLVVTRVVLLRFTRCT
uniref:Galectin n=1 Tax=Sinocyclocheilus grahami TaxID=75366 RepID=A0A672MWN2_SINGR